MVWTCTTCGFSIETPRSCPPSAIVASDIWSTRGNSEMVRPPQFRAALVGRSLAEAQWVTTPSSLRAHTWSPSRQVMSTLRVLRRASPRFADAVVAHAEERWRELAFATERRPVRTDTLMSS